MGAPLVLLEIFIVKIVNINVVGIKTVNINTINPNDGRMMEMTGQLRYLVVTLLLTGVGCVVWAQPVPFHDISDSQYPEAIRYLQRRELISGYPDGTFRPAGEVSRAELTALLMAERLDSTPAAAACFVDVINQWYAGYVCAAKEAGLIQGYQDAHFRPDEAVSYVEALKLVIQAFGFPVDEMGTLEQGDWYTPYQDFAHYYAILDVSTYAPADPLSRDAMAQLVYRAVVMRDNAALIASIVPPPSAQPVTESATDPVTESATEPELAAVAAPAPAPSVERNWSAGCGRPPPDPLARLSLAGRERQLITVIPENYHANRPHRLVFAFHGRTNANHQVRRYYEIEGVWEDAIIIYPQGLPRGNGYSWSDAGDRASNLRDYAFFDAMLEHFSANYCLNLDQVYALGHSLGGWFSSSLGCARGDQLRAVASLGGSISVSECRGNVAAMVIHNPNDRLVPFAQGEATRDVFLTQNNLNLQAQTSTPQFLACQQYGGGSHPSSHPVKWCPHRNDHSYSGRYYPHNWPDGAGQAMLEFFGSLP